MPEGSEAADRGAGPGRGRLLALVLALTVLALLPDLSPEIVPVCDTRISQLQFHGLASSLYAHREIPFWCPYGRYGNSSEPVLYDVTPFGYLVAVAGAALRIPDTLVLYKLAVGLELLVFAAGLFRLGTCLYREPWLAALLALAGVATAPWYTNIDANFHLVYLLPLILEALFRYAEDPDGGRLVRIASLCVLSAIGNTPYYAPGAALLLTVAAAVLALHGRLPRPRWPAGRAWRLEAGATLALAAAFVGLYRAGFAGHEWLNFGRDPESGRVPLGVFLSYGGVARPGPLLEAMATGAQLHGDNTFYIGLAPLALLPLALLVPDPRAAALWAAAWGMVLVSFGGPLAVQAWHFPGMAYYRYIAMAYSQIRVLLLAAAGCAADRLVARAAGRPGPAGSLLVPLLLAAGLAGLSAREAAAFRQNASPVFQFALFPGLEACGTPAAVRLAALRAALYLVAVLAGLLLVRRRTDPDRWRVPAGLLALAFLLDVGSFRALGVRALGFDAPGEAARAAETFRARPLPYRPTRVPSPELQAGDPRLAFLFQLGMGTRYGILYTAAEVDPSLPVFRTDSVPGPLGRLLAGHGVRLVSNRGGTWALPDDPWLARALGAGVPKLRLVRTSDLVPQGDGLAEPLPFRAEAPEPGRVEVRDFSWNRLAAEVRVEGPDPVWLYYADGYHPGWTARVDGVPAEVRVANQAFKAVGVGPGVHRVELAFFAFPGSVPLLGLVLGSLLCVPALLGACLRTP